MINRRKRGLLIISIIILVSLLVILCGSLFYDNIRNKERTKSAGKDENQVEIELVYAYQNAQWNSAIEATVRNFEKKYPNIKVNYEVNYEDKVYEDILIKKIARNELGDIVQLKTPGSYARSDTLGEISDEVKNLVKYTYDVGGNFADFYVSVPCGGSDLWHMEYWVNHFFRTDVLSKNPDWLKQCSEGVVSWTDAEAIQMLNDLKNLFDAGYVNDDWQTTRDGNLPYKMAEGEIAMLYTGPWTSFAIQKLNPSMELGWFYVPDVKGVTYAGDNLDTFWSVTKECEEDPDKYDAAMTFLKYFYSEQNYTLTCEAICSLPLTKEWIATAGVPFQEETERAFRSSDKQIATYIGDEDTPVDFEKGMLLLLRSEWNSEVSVTDMAQHIQQLWNSCEASQEANQ